MENSKKMKLSDLQPREPDRIDWDSLDEFFYKDAPAILSQPLILATVIKEKKLLEVEQIDSATVTSYLTGLTRDTDALSQSYVSMKSKYEMGRNQYKGNYDENAHMFSLQIAYEITEWTERYEDTMGQNFVAVIDYINSVLPEDSNIKLTK